MGVILYIQCCTLKAWVACSHQVVETYIGLRNESDCIRIMLHSCGYDLETVGKDAKGILQNATTSEEPVVEDLLFCCHVTMVEGFHHVGPQGKCIVTQDEVWHVLVIMGKRFWCRETNAAIL